MGKCVFSYAQDDKKKKINKSLKITFMDNNGGQKLQSARPRNIKHMSDREIQAIHTHYLYG